MIDSNYLIINRTPQRFAEMKTAGRTLVFVNSEGKVLDYGVQAVDDSIYAILYCDEVRNITMVVDKGVRSVVTILWRTEDDYLRAKDTVGRSYRGNLSAQNLRINRYAEAIAEKLDNGVRLRVADAVDASGMVRCPECGILNPSGTDYCLECGADI
jgi:hypothetical protein